MPTIATDRPSEKLHLLVESAYDNNSTIISCKINKNYKANSISKLNQTLIDKPNKDN
ncbi:hypothetical protein [Photorhabdus laumondii]|uniref:hypothetical protein n=1 Tax=Photorhabdus laumondii TaxID=2218628 RepID=UPI000B040400|nr:hypothetical protein [Photorhabdus laumondii]